MGNTLVTTQQIACGHTDSRALRQTLLCDRLSQPTADMVEAIAALEDRTDRLRQFADRDRDQDVSDVGPRPLNLLVASYCVLLGGPGNGYGAGAGSSRDPKHAKEQLDSFDNMLRKPQDFLHRLTALRAQAVPRERLNELLVLMQSGELRPSSFRGQYSDLLRSLASFMQAAVECTEIYMEIRECAATGKLDQQQAARLLDGVESDQSRMIGAMGSSRAYDDEEEVDN